MCATYTYHVDEATLRAIFPSLLIDESSPFEKTKETVFPHTWAPVIVARDGAPMLTAKRYSLTPSWSKEEKVKWATYNARMNRVNTKTGKPEFIFEVPTWKHAFGENHCLVPLNNFRESCHEGKAAGNIVAFTPNDSPMLFAAGIYENWIDKKTGEEISTFAIITTDPSDFLKEVGHDRSPLFLTPDTAMGWLAPFPSAKAAYSYLEDHGFHPSLEYEVVRQLKNAATQLKLGD